VACAVCGTFEYAVDQARGSSVASQADRLFDENSVAALERRIALQAPTNKHTTHGPAGNADDVELPQLVEILPAAIESGRIAFAAAAVFKRPHSPNSQPRAPPRGSAR